MQINNISNQIFTNKNRADVSFQSKLTFDVGASDPRGSLKILVQDNGGKDLFEYKGFINDTTAGFKDNNDFVRKVAQSADVEELIKKDIAGLENTISQNHLGAEELDALKKKISDLQLKQSILQNRSEAEKKLTGFALLLPGTIQGKMALFMANLKTVDRKSLENVNLLDVIKEIIKQNKVELSEKFNINRDFIPSKDLAGTGIGIAKKIVNHPEYSKRFDKGFFAVAVQTGGGFGAVDIKLKENTKVDIETDESSHDLYFDKKTRKPKRLGKLGASTGSIIENYSKKLGIDDSDDIKALVRTGLAQLATDEKIKLNKTKDADAIKVLLKSGFYEIVEDTQSTSILQIKNECLSRFDKASRSAIRSYADAISLHAVTKINRGANLYVMSGPLAMGLNDSIKKNPRLYGANDMRELVFKFIEKHVGDDFTCNKLKAANKFDIVCDRAMSIDNNTSGGALLLSKNTRTFARRGEWMRIPTKVLKSLT